MGFSFTDNDIKAISEILGAEADKLDDSFSWKLKNEETGQSLVLSLYNGVDLGRNINGPLISIQTKQGYYELHDCMSYVIFEPDEVIFINANDDLVSCLIVGRGSTCSLYSNISRDILSADFASLDPAVLLSAMQLSLTETALP